MSALTETLIKEIQAAPEEVQREVFDYLEALKSRENSEGRESLVPLAASAWKADWDSPEEDAAWRDL